MTKLIHAWALCLAILLGGCVKSTGLPIWRTTAAPEGTRTAIPVFFATDRIPSAETRGTAAYLQSPFSSQIYLDRANPVSFGEAIGSVARTPASLGDCEPGWWTQTTSATKPGNRFPLEAVNMMERDRFYAALDDALDQLATKTVGIDCTETGLSAPKRRVLLYVHGFNDGFDEAASNAAQLVYDLDMRAVPVIFSWPTQQSLLAYTRDETYAERAAPLLKQLIAGILDLAKPAEFHIVAHSLGARLTLQALQELSTERVGRFAPITSLVLYAPDLDTLAFERIYMGDLARYAGRVSVYSNTNDIPLSVSRRVNGGYALGDFDGVPFTGPGFHSIDVGPARQARLNHSGFEDTPLITQQIQNDLLGVKPSERPCLCRIAVSDAPATSPKGSEPYYRIAIDRAQCPFKPPVYLARKGTPACPQ